MRNGRIEEADGIARLIGKKIACWNSVRLKSINLKTDQKDMWKKVKQFSNRGCTRTTQSNLTATQLNDHYARISTASNYHAPGHKHTVLGEDLQLTEWTVFKALDTLRHTATGLTNSQHGSWDWGHRCLPSQSLRCLPSLCQHPLSQHSGNRPSYDPWTKSRFLKAKLTIARYL